MADVDLDSVREFAESSDNPYAKALGRYAATSAEFAAAGGAIGSVVPGVGTAIGALVGSYAGVLWEAGSDLYPFLKSLFSDDADETRKRLADFATAYGLWLTTGQTHAVAFPRWWFSWVRAGRPKDVAGVAVLPLPPEGLVAATRAGGEAARRIRDLELAWDLYAHLGGYRALPPFPAWWALWRAAGRPPASVVIAAKRALDASAKASASAAVPQTYRGTLVTVDGSIRTGRFAPSKVAPTGYLIVSATEVKPGRFELA